MRWSSGWRAAVQLGALPLLDRVHDFPGRQRLYGSTGFRIPAPLAVGVDPGQLQPMVERLDDLHRFLHIGDRLPGCRLKTPAPEVSGTEASDAEMRRSRIKRPMMDSLHGLGLSSGTKPHGG